MGASPNVHLMNDYRNWNCPNATRLYSWTQRTCASVRVQKCNQKNHESKHAVTGGKGHKCGHKETRLKIMKIPEDWILIIDLRRACGSVKWRSACQEAEVANAAPPKQAVSPESRFFAISISLAGKLRSFITTQSHSSRTFALIMMMLRGVHRDPRILALLGVAAMVLIRIIPRQP